MPRGVDKEHLPTKVCEVCGRPFVWRKKWARCWDQVHTCSHRCQQERKRRKRPRTADEDPQQFKITRLERIRTSHEQTVMALISRWLPALTCFGGTLLLRPSRVMLANQRLGWFSATFSATLRR
ncbi:hypothetical protein CCYA_CCYA07G2115 [Cyanidiococcus yangmingshanensis]|nr:hypothetical protein CCYA_CCYA07G2115 [Cyanidiococcus yangmingshanensis]